MASDSSGQIRSTPRGWRESTIWPFPSPSNLGQAIDNLIMAIELHRLVFLYLTVPRCSGNRLDHLMRQEHFGSLAEELVKASGNEHEIFWQYRRTIDVYAQKLYSVCGPPIPISTPSDSLEPCWWAVDGSACMDLENGAHTILLAVQDVYTTLLNSHENELKRLDRDELDRLLNECQTITHDGGRDRWYACFSADWNYPGQLDSMVIRLKRFTSRHALLFDWRDRASNAGGSNAPNDSRQASSTIEVFDPVAKDTRRLDLRNAFRWGPIEENQKFGCFDEGVLSWDSVELVQILNQGWVLLTTFEHMEAPTSGCPVATRISAEEAATWLVKNGFEPPEEIAHFAKEAWFDPAIEPDANSSAELQDLPTWDEQSGKLTYRDSVVRSVKQGASNVRKVLAAFQEDGWPPHILSVFSDTAADKERLRETLRSLNDGLESIRFKSDGSGTGICWEIKGANPQDDSIPF